MRFGNREYTVFANEETDDKGDFYLCYDIEKSKFCVVKQYSDLSCIIGYCADFIQARANYKDILDDKHVLYNWILCRFHTSESELQGHIG